MFSSNVNWFAIYKQWGRTPIQIRSRRSFLDDNKDNPTPPITHLRELQASVKAYEEDEDGKNGDEWIPILFAPGSSLGGARPKANVVDLDGNLCIAKFPSKANTTDKAGFRAS